MLQEIIDTKDFNFDGYIELKKYARILNSEDYANIKYILNNFFNTKLYTEQGATLKTIGLQPKRTKTSNGASKYIHGIYHVEKVFLYCYIMVKMYNNENEEKIPNDFANALYFAALYHDIGRIDNSEDVEHGLNAAKIFNNIFKDTEVFKEKKLLLYLTEFLMAIHSTNNEIKLNDDIDTGRIKYLIEEIQYNNDEKNFDDTSAFKEYTGKYLKILCDLLKDADALDRKRFGEWTRESLDENYLRTKYSKLLIQFADEINRVYYINMEYQFIEPDISKMEKRDCFHSIGFDFFKIGSILNNGVLSQGELKRKNISVPRNFPGGNFDRWISVVDTLLYPEYAKIENLFINDEELTKRIQDYLKEHPEVLLNEEKKEQLSSEVKREIDDIKRIIQNKDEFDPSAKELKWASSEFTHHGITFYCADVALFKPEEDKDKALEQGLPWNKSGYVDEKYVYKKILPSNIIGVFIPFECINTDVKTLWYVFESSDMDIVRSRIDYYKRYTEVSFDDSRLEILNILLDEYEALIIDELSKASGEGNSKAYLEASKMIMTKINKIIGEFVFEYYCKIFSSKQFGIKEIVEYELSNVLGIDYNIVNLYELNCNELFFEISRTKEKIKII